MGDIFGKVAYRCEWSDIGINIKSWYFTIIIIILPSNSNLMYEVKQWTKCECR